MRLTTLGWATALGALAMALLPTAGTSAAWSDGVSVAAPDAMTALRVPRPVLRCVETPEGAAIAWPQGALPGTGTPAVEYAARVAETGARLDVVADKGQRFVRVTPESVAPAANGDVRTVQVRASATFGVSTTWIASETHPVTVYADRTTTRVACA